MDERFWKDTALQAAMNVIIMSIVSLFIAGPSQFFTTRNCVYIIVSAIAITVCTGVERYSRGMPRHLPSAPEDDGR